MNDIHEVTTKIFNEWAKRYAENPDEFDSVLDEDGRPVLDYGARASVYFWKLYNELELNMKD